MLGRVHSFNSTSNVSHTVKPIACGQSFPNLTTQTNIEFCTSLLPRFVEKRPIRLKLENEIKRHSKCKRHFWGIVSTTTILTIPSSSKGRT